jgi:hypothetical protein
MKTHQNKIKLIQQKGNKMSKSDVKLQINSLEALERLIGGDSQFEMELRNSVVQSFANKHFNAVVRDEHFQKELEKTKKAVTAEVEKEIAEVKSGWNNKSVKLSDDIKNAIKHQVTYVVRDAVREYTESNEFRDDIKHKLDYYTQEYIRHEVKTRLKNAMSNITSKVADNV